MIVKRKSVRRAGAAPREWLHYSDDGGLTQFGAYVETLQPGADTGERHWHEKEDEFLYVLEGEATVIEDSGETVLHPGDAAGWPGGVANGHCVVNRSAAPCTYMIVGTRLTHDVCHYPDSGKVQHQEGENWRVEARDGTILRSGRSKSPPGRD
ncbi:MAG: cupin domain-containing protein [Usitatibacter sp.]